MPQKPRDPAPPHRAMLDSHIGARIRARRVELGQSQTALAEKIRTSFQQVQKYERGINRVSASTLYDIAAVQSVEISYYFDGFEPPQPE